MVASANKSRTGSFYISYGSTMTPLFASFAQFAKSGGSVYSGLTDATFNASYGELFRASQVARSWLIGMDVVGFYWLTFTIWILFYALRVLRTNVVFVAMFLTITPAVGCITALCFHVAQGNLGAAYQCQLVSSPILMYPTLVLICNSDGWSIAICNVLLRMVPVRRPDFPIGRISYSYPTW